MRWSPTLSLREFQQRFKEAVRNPKNLRSDDALLIRQTGEFSVQDRLSIYQFAYKARLLESLQDALRAFLAPERDAVTPLSMDEFTTDPTRARVLLNHSVQFDTTSASDHVIIWWAKDDKRELKLSTNEFELVEYLKGGPLFSDLVDWIASKNFSVELLSGTYATDFH